MVPEVCIAGAMAPEQAYPRPRHMQFLALGAAAALAAQYALQWLGHTPWWQRVSRRFIWWRPDAPPHSPYGSYAGKGGLSTILLCLSSLCYDCP